MGRFRGTAGDDTFRDGIEDVIPEPSTHRWREMRKCPCQSQTVQAEGQVQGTGLNIGVIRAPSLWPKFSVKAVGNVDAEESGEQSFVGKQIVSDQMDHQNAAEEPLPKPVSFPLSPNPVSKPPD